MSLVAHSVSVLDSFTAAVATARSGADPVVEKACIEFSFFAFVMLTVVHVLAVGVRVAQINAVRVATSNFTRVLAFASAPFVMRLGVAAATYVAGFQME